MLFTSGRATLRTYHQRWPCQCLLIE